MPKSLSENEREYIKQRLIEEATYCLTHYGVKKTTVDEIVSRAKIAKGTFYLFYTSKELLLFDVFNRLHDDYQERLLKEIADIKDNLNPDRLTEIIFKLYKTMDDSFILKLMMSGELEALFRKLPPEVAQLHAEKDDLRVEALVSMVPNMKAGQVQVFSAALQGIFLSMLYKEDVGKDVFDEALKVMIRGVAIQMFEGDRP